MWYNKIYMKIIKFLLIGLALSLTTEIFRFTLIITSWPDYLDFSLKSIGSNNWTLLRKQDLLAGFFGSPIGALLCSSRVLRLNEKSRFFYGSSLSSLLF